MEEYYIAHGKLMLTGEYFVLDGAKSLALPTYLGQTLKIKRHHKGSHLNWKSLDIDGTIWFETEIDALAKSSTNQGPVGRKLLELLIKAKELNPAFEIGGVNAEIKSEFDLEWGLGSSSTLVSLIAQWANIDPYELQFSCFGGSGYDIACATADGPILYHRWPKPGSEKVIFHPNFSNLLHFVFLGKKQDSRKGINQYKEKQMDKASVIQGLDSITRAILKTGNLEEFQGLLQKHEDLVSESLGILKVKDRLFSDFKGFCKSLGAWGGDFILVASHESANDVQDYFRQRGFHTILPFSKLVMTRA